MTAPAASLAPAPRKRGPNTPEGKARSAMNAVKHGLRARAFGILPEEDQAEWAEHVRDLRAGYGPVDAAEEKLVTAIAVAMWKEIRADRLEAEAMLALPPPGSPDAAEPAPSPALSLGTAIRYASAAGMATQRAQRAFLEHRKAKRAGLILPATECQERANELAPSPPARTAPTGSNTAWPDLPPAVQPPANDAGPAPASCTNDFRPAESDAAPAAGSRLDTRPDGRMVAHRPLAAVGHAGPPRPPSSTPKHVSVNRFTAGT